MLALLALLALQEADLPRLVELLSDPSIEVRHEAAARLAALGRDAIPALRKAVEGSDAQRSAAARDVLAQIDRRLRVQELRPPLLRRALKIEDLPFAEAVVRTAQAFGLDVPSCDESARQRRVSLELNDATLWEGIDALCRAGEVELDLPALRFREPSRYRRCQNRDDVRLLLDSSNVKWHNSQVKVLLRLSLALPPGAWVEKLRLTDVSVTMDGRVLRHTAETSFAFACHRIRGLPTWMTVGTVYVPDTVAGGLKALDLRGTLVLSLPDEIEDVAAEGGEILKLPFADVEGRWREDRRSYTVSASGQTGADELAFQVAAWDDVGRACDMPFRIRPHALFQQQQAEILRSKPTRLEVWRVTRTLEREIPFRFQAVDVPDTLTK